MTIHRADDGTIELQGACELDDAEALQQYLIENAQATVDWRSCTAAHTALIQILMAAKPALRGPPAGSFLRLHIEPLVNHRNV